MGTYIPYHMHTEYSLLDSCDKPQAYIDLAVRDGIRAISFSEHGKPLNWTEKWDACRKSGIKYIFSVEAYLTESLNNKVRDNYHTVLMAKNMDGVREINSLISKSFSDDHFYYNNRITFDEFLNMSENVISTSACLASPLNKLPEDHPMYMRLARKYDFLEVQPHIHQDQIQFNKRLVVLAKRLGKKLIAGTDTHSSSKYKSECRKVLLSSKNKSYGDEDAFDLSYKTYDELVDMFRRQGALSEEEYMEAIQNTNMLYDMTEELKLDTSIKYPILYGSREADSKKFSETVESMFAEKVASGEIPSHQVEAFRAAIDEEMRVFRKLNMDGFMLSMSEILRWCRKNGMALGTARGSVGGSRVAYVTDIIDLNPETWHTVFSRFCNEDRVEIGDIDVDCIESDRPAIFRYITGRFGADKTARVPSFGTSQEKDTIDNIGRHLAKKWKEANPGGISNPWGLDQIAKIKEMFSSEPEKARKKYPELFYYFDGIVGTKVSQSVHPAGIVISPITLPDNFGVFDKDGESCLMLDMENIHDYTGLAKYDFLLLKTVQVIRDTCRYLGRDYPKTSEIDWFDKDVWDSMIKSPSGIFQFEGKFAFESLKKFKPSSIFDMSIVTACIRPSGASYREQLLARVVHKNPSSLIDDLLKDNLGYLIYQEDTIRFLQLICGLSGSDADNIRRAIGRKQKDRLDKAMPSILDGYCRKSDKPRDIAENEAKEFLRVIEDSASYQFGYNHSIAYCLLGYLCAYFRHYYPVEFITAFLNNAANDEDIRNGTLYASKVGIKVTMPKWGFSKGDYFFDRDKKVIAKGITSIKYMGAKIADELYDVAHQKPCNKFIDVLNALKDTSVDARQLDILIKLDFFSAYGNQRELLRIEEMYTGLFKKGDAIKISKSKIDGTPLERLVKMYSVGVTKSGGQAKSYTLLDVQSILYGVEDAVKSVGMSDLDDITKVRNFNEAMGYVGYVSNKDSDRRKLYVLNVFPLYRRKDNKLFGYNIMTKSIGSGIESKFTIFCNIFDKEPIKKDDIILCQMYERNQRGYFTMTKYEKLF